MFSKHNWELNEQLKVWFVYIAYDALRLIVGGQIKLNTQ